MNPLRTSLLAVAAVGAAIAPATVAQAAPTQLGSLAAPTQVAAWNGTVMWSELDAATGKYKLVKSVDGGAPAAVPVPERAGGPFDVDLGTNRSGATYAVYTRAGDIYRLSVASGAETKITKLSSPTLAERDPTIQRGEIAFVRRSGGFDELRVGNTTSGSKGSRLIVRKRSIVNAELGIGTVAYVDVTRAAYSVVVRSVHVRTISTGRDKVVYQARSGGANDAGITKPSYGQDLGGFVWARTNNGAGGGNRFVRYSLSTGKLGYAVGSSHYNSTAWAGAQLGAATASSLDASDSAGACTDAGRNYCQVTLTGPLTFTARP